MTDQSLKTPPSIQVVLVQTTLPANIGGVARAMMTMGLSQLVLVNPKQPIDETSYAHAKGGGVILDNATVVDTLPLALANCQLVIATSSRNRSIPRPMLNPKNAAALVAEFANKHQNPTIALVFGREDRGLTNDELSLADYHLSIRANPAYPVLNLASSVQVVVSYLYDELAAPLPPCQKQQTPISHAQRQQLNALLFSLFTDLELGDDKKSEQLLWRIRHLSSQFHLSPTDFKLIMAFLYQLQKRLTN